MKSSLLKKRALDALNIELNRPSAAEDPRADTDYTNPFRGKGTEIESLKRGSVRDLTLTSLRYFRQMAARHPGLRPRILAHCERLSEVITASTVDLHESPTQLPPRHDTRKYVHQDIKDELEENKVAGKEIILTPEQVSRWDELQEAIANDDPNFPNNPTDEQWAEVYAEADKQLEEEYPELVGKSWTFPGGREELTYDPQLEETQEIIESIQRAGCKVTTSGEGNAVQFTITTKAGNTYGPMTQAGVFWFLEGYTIGRGKKVN